MRASFRSLLVVLGFALAAPAPLGELAHAGRPGAAAAKGPRKARQPRKDVRHQVNRQLAELRETLYISRDIATHMHFLGQTFFRSLKGLGKGDHWIEIGPSQDARMAMGYLFDTPEAQPYGFPREKARVTGIGLEPLHPQLEAQLEPAMRQRGVRYEHRSGRYLESYKRREIDRATMVSDQFGAFAYTGRPQKIIEVEGELLLRGGTLHTHSSPFTRVVDKQGNDVFIEWMKAIEGLELVEHEKVESGKHSWHQVALRRTTGSVRAPPLRQTYFEAGHPPVREFVWDGRPARAERAPRRRASESSTTASP